MNFSQPATFGTRSKQIWYKIEWREYALHCIIGNQRIKLSYFTEYILTAETFASHMNMNVNTMCSIWMLKKHKNTHMNTHSHHINLMTYSKQQKTTAPTIDWNQWKSNSARAREREKKSKKLKCILIRECQKMVSNKFICWWRAISTFIQVIFIRVYTHIRTLTHISRKRSLWLMIHGSSSCINYHELDQKHYHACPMEVTSTILNFMWVN